MAHSFKDGRGVGGVKRNQARKMLIFSAWMGRNPKLTLPYASPLPAENYCKGYDVLLRTEEEEEEEEVRP